MGKWLFCAVRAGERLRKYGVSGHEHVQWLWMVPSSLRLVRDDLLMMAEFLKLFFSSAHGMLDT